MGRKSPAGVNFVGDHQAFSVDHIHFSVFFRQLPYRLADLSLVSPRGFVAVGIEDLDARIADRIVTGGDHAPHPSAECEHGVMEGGCGARVDVNHVASRQSESEGQGSDQGGVVRALVPSNDDRVAFTGQRRLCVREGFPDQSHEGRRQRPVLFKTVDGHRLVNVFE